MSLERASWHIWKHRTEKLQMCVVDNRRRRSERKKRLGNHGCPHKGNVHEPTWTTEEPNWIIL
jgi:hypothetical protein